MTLRPLVPALLAVWLGVAAAADPAPAKPASGAAPAAKTAASGDAHRDEDIRRHRTIAAAHEAAARCQEAGRKESECMAELAKACKGIAYGKYCGMRHAD